MYSVVALYPGIFSKVENVTRDKIRGENQNLLEKVVDCKIERNKGVDRLNYQQRRENRNTRAGKLRAHTNTGYSDGANKNRQLNRRRQTG